MSSKLLSKLTLLLYGIIFLVAIYIANRDYQNSIDSAKTQAKGELKLKVDIAKGLLQKRLNSYIAEIKFLSTNPRVKLSSDFFNTSVSEIGKEWRDNLKKRYLLKDMGADVGNYDTLHKAMDPFFSQFAKIGDYRDILILNPNADVIYSVKKDHKLATNLKDGNTTLYKLYLKIKKSKDIDIVSLPDVDNFFASKVVDSGGDVIAYIVAEIDGDIFKKYGEVKRVKESCKDIVSSDNGRFYARSCFDFMNRHYKIESFLQEESVYKEAKDQFYRLLFIFMVLAIISIILGNLFVRQFFAKDEE
jgi:hypothetical protein